MSLADHPLHALPKYGDGTGLHRVRFLMEACGLDAAEIAARAVAVTGSNGKGSTARIAAGLLTAAGGPTGLFTSPHLYRYNERFRIDGAPVDDAPLLKAMDRVAAAVARYRAEHGDTVGAFEAQFVVALEVLRPCRWLVFEAGIGGRFDPVRCARAPVAGLVSLDLEHTELLGKTLSDIALDKLDIAPPGGTVFLGPTCCPFEAQIRAVAALSDVGVRFTQSGEDRGAQDGWQRFDLAGFAGLRSRLVGRHQIANHAVAFALAQARLEKSGLWPISDIAERWREAVAAVAWPGRLETISHDPRVIIDVGHTPEGVRAALDGFRALNGTAPALLVTGGSKNKHVREMLALLAPSFDRIVCTAAHHNGLAARDVESLVKDIRPQAQTLLCPAIGDAVMQVRREATARGLSVYVAGGLFLAAEFAEAWRGGDPRALRFF